jgi:hypothetical protein
MITQKKQAWADGIAGTEKMRIKIALSNDVLRGGSNFYVVESWLWAGAPAIWRKRLCGWPAAKKSVWASRQRVGLEILLMFVVGVAAWLYMVHTLSQFQADHRAEIAHFVVSAIDAVERPQHEK